MGIKVLSLFDGISCGMVALERAGIEVERYVAYEIDENAIKVSKYNYPNIEQIGNVVGADFTQYKGFDLVIGGSPCQNLSCAGDGSGIFGEKSFLFFEFVRALKEVSPKHFLFENVSSMSKKSKSIINNNLKCEPIEINSSLFSAQSRKRLYWTNIELLEFDFCVKNILLSEVLINKNSIPEKAWHSEKAIAYMNRKVNGKARLYNGQGVTFENQQKSSTITANYRKGVPYNVFVYNDGSMRKLTEEECEILQTLPIGYTSCLCSTKRYECIGNGWTVDVIAHILKGIK